MSTIDTAPGLAADVARIKRIEQLESLLVESNEYARKLWIKVTDLGGDIERLKSSLHQWRKLAEMLIERIEQLERELSEANEYARKLNLKLTDLCAERDAAKARNQRLMDAGGRLFEELDDKTPDPNCRCHVFPPCSDCTNHASSREALKEWKEANK